MNEIPRIVMAGGGTGGHLFPALSIADELQRRFNAQITFFGTKRGIESRVIPARGYHLDLLPVRGLQRRLSWQNLLFPFRLLRSIRICRRKMRVFQPHLVIGTGGYVMGPVVKSAVKLDVPFVLQEQNSYPGVTTRLAADKAKMIFIAYPEAKKYLKTGGKVVLSGNPVFERSASQNLENDKEFAELDPNLKTILVFGGSQGAMAINRAVLKLLLDEGIARGFQMLWQTGERDYENIKDSLRSSGRDLPVILAPFIEKMTHAFQVAEFAVCRAGAMTISELIKYRLPAIYIPLKSAAANHQYKNALEIQKIDGGRVLEEDEKLHTNLAMAVKTFCGEPGLLKDMAENLKALDMGDAQKNIVDEIARLMNWE